jgi:hypothetical protein
MGRFGTFGVSPLPPRSIGINVVAENCELVHGAQSLAGKILVSKNFEADVLGSNSRIGTDVVSAHRLGLDDDRAIGIVEARLDVTGECGKNRPRLLGLAEQEGGFDGSGTPLVGAIIVGPALSFDYRSKLISIDIKRSEGT